MDGYVAASMEEDQSVSSIAPGPPQSGEESLPSVAFGSVRVSRAVEWVGPILAVDALFPSTPREVWENGRTEFDPVFWDASTNAFRAAIQTWVVRSGGLTVLVDTGVGDGRDRPQVPLFSDLHTGFDRRLREGGVALEEVDVVVNTHIHYDHVGWNTRWDGDAWVPTFPNARYVVPRADFEYFDPEHADRMRAPETDDERRRFEGIALVFEDSVRPIADAGQIELWSDKLDLTPGLRLAAAPGHTPGSSVLWLDGDENPGAVFVGDLLHSPMQVARPDDPCAFDLDRETATRSRRAVLAQAAERGSSVFPAHYPGHGGVSIRKDRQLFAINQWLDLPSV